MCEKNFKKWITKCYGITKLDGLHSDKVQQLHLYTILPLQKEIETHVFILSLYLVRSRNWIGNFQLEKKVYHWNLMNEQKQPLTEGILQNSCSKEYQADCMIKPFENC